VIAKVFGRTKRIDTTKTQVEELNQLCFAEKSSAEQQSEDGRANTVMKFPGEAQPFRGSSPNMPFF